LVYSDAGLRRRVWLEPGATIGSVFLAVPEAFVVITNPRGIHRDRYRLAKRHAVVFALPALIGRVAPSRRSEAVPLDVPVLQINAAGLFLYDGVAGDLGCGLAAHTGVAVLATDPRRGILVITRNRMAEQRGWLPVTQTRNGFLVLRPSVRIPVGSAC
jgi:hypothetical protein